MPNRFLIASAALVALGCGSAAGMSRSPQRDDAVADTTVPPEPEAEPEAEPEPVSRLTAEQRQVLAPELGRYGSGWTLSEVEKAFLVEATAIPNGYELLFVARGHSGLFARRQIEIGGTFGGPGLQLPEAPELTAQQRNQADAALRGARELWLLGSNNECSRLDVSQGLTAIVGQSTLQTRYHDGRAVLMVAGEGHNDPFVVVIDLEGQRILEAREHSLPPIIGRGMLRAAEVTFIDQALRQHGSFGVYGDVTRGLRALVADSRVQISREEDRYDMYVFTRDGHGHELSFSIDRRTGVIENMAAGHSVPPPE